MSGKRTVLLFAMLFVTSVLILSTAAGAATSTRSLPDSVNVGDFFTVSITGAD